MQVARVQPTVLNSMVKVIEVLDQVFTVSATHLTTVSLHVDINVEVI